MIIDMETILKTFDTIPDIIGKYFENIPAELLDRKRSEAAWTIREHLYHLAGLQDMMYKRILTIKEDDKPVIKPYFPEDGAEDTFNYKSVGEAVAYYKQMRTSQISLLKSLTEAEIDKEAVHAEYSSYNIPIILNHMIFHEYWHMFRIEEIWLTKDEYFS